MKNVISLEDFKRTSVWNEFVPILRQAARMYGLTSNETKSLETSFKSVFEKSGEIKDFNINAKLNNGVVSMPLEEFEKIQPRLEQDKVVIQDVLMLAFNGMIDMTIKNRPQS